MPLYRGFSTTVPATDNPNAATAGTSGNIARSDHSHPRYSPEATDFSYVGWTQDPFNFTSTTQITASGTLQVCQVRIPVAATVTNIIMRVTTGGGTLTSGQSFAALYDPNKSLLSVTADQSTAWTSVGLKTMALSVAQSVAAGIYYVAFWSVGTTMPIFQSGASTTMVNAGLSGATSRFAIADTGLTTTAPPTMGAFTATSLAYGIILN